jgi:DNA primase
MADTVQQIKDRLSIIDVVGSYVKLERAGQNMRARCPFHNEKTPSFMVSPDRGSYHCFGCGVGGDIFSFVEAIEGLDFKGALKVLADKAGVTIEYGGGSKNDDDTKDRLYALMDAAALFYASRLTDDVKKYLHDRGLTDETITAFRIGWAGSAWEEAVTHLKAKRFSEKELVDAGLAKKNERGGLTDKFRNRIINNILTSNVGSKVYSSSDLFD